MSTPAARSLLIDKTLRLAIEERRLIRLRYSGKLRIAEPHDFGIKKGSYAFCGP